MHIKYSPHPHLSTVAFQRMKLLKDLPYTLAHRTIYSVPSTERGKQETHSGAGGGETAMQNITIRLFVASYFNSKILY